MTVFGPIPKILYQRRKRELHLIQGTSKTTNIMSILVTGTSGFLGGSLVKHLLRQEQSQLHKIIGTFRSQRLPATSVFPDAFQSVISPANANNKNPPRLLFEAEMNVNFQSEESLRELLQRHDDIVSVVHLGFLMEFHPKSEAEGREITSVNLNSARNLLNAIKWYQQLHKRKVQFIFASSQESMGPVLEKDGTNSAEEKMPAVETTPCKPTYLYGQNKRDVELMLIHQDKDSSVNVESFNFVDYTILRVCGVTGKGDRYAVFEMIQAASRGMLISYPGECHGICSFVHVSDVLQAITLCMENKQHSKNQVFIIGPNSSVTFRRCIDVICDALGSSRPYFVMPASLFKALVSALYPLYNTVRNYLDANQRHDVSFLFHPDTVDNLEEDRWYSSEKAKQVLGYKPMELEDAIRLAVREHIEEGAIAKKSKNTSRSLIFFGSALTVTILLACAYWVFN